MSLTSVIIPTHNRPHLLSRAVESARAAGTNLEVIVVDDASTDETATVCATLRGIKYVRVERNQRVAGARNVGLLVSSGEFVSFLDDDDLRLPNSLDEQVKLLEADKQAGLIYGQAILGDQAGQSTNHVYPLVCPHGDAFWDLLGQNFIPCGSAVFRRSCLNRVGLLDGDLPGIDDWDLWIRIAELYPIIALAKPVMIWRRSMPVSEQGTSQAADIVSKHEVHVLMKHDVRQLRNRGYRDVIDIFARLEKRDGIHRLTVGERFVRREGLVVFENQYGYRNRRRLVHLREHDRQRRPKVFERALSGTVLSVHASALYFTSAAATQIERAVEVEQPVKVEQPFEVEQPPVEIVSSSPAPAAPPLALPDLDGKITRLEDYRGKVVLLFFWATW